MYGHSLAYGYRGNRGGGGNVCQGKGLKHASQEEYVCACMYVYVYAYVSVCVFM